MKLETKQLSVTITRHDNNIYITFISSLGEHSLRYYTTPMKFNIVDLINNVSYELQNISDVMELNREIDTELE